MANVLVILYELNKPAIQANEQNKNNKTKLSFNLNVQVAEEQL